MLSLLIFILSFGAFAKEIVTIEFHPNQTQYTVKLKRDLVRIVHDQDCYRRDDGGYNCTPTTREVPSYNLEANLSLEITKSELIDYKQALTFEMDRFGVVRIKDNKDSVMIVASLEAQSPVRQISNQMTRSDFYKMRVLDKKPIERFLNQGIQGISNEGTVLKFKTQTVPDNFKQLFKLLIGRKCRIWYGDFINLTASPLLKEELQGDGNTLFSIDMRELEREEGLRIMRRKACIDIRTRIVPADFQSYEFIIGSPETNENHLFE